MSAQLAKRIGASSRKARLTLRLTQVDVAERLGLSVEFYARIERGNSMPSTPTLFLLGQHLGISLDEVARPSSTHTSMASIDASEFYQLGSSDQLRIYRRLQTASPYLLRLVGDLMSNFDRAVEEAVVQSRALAEAPDPT